MYNINDKLIYNKEVCVVKDILKKVYQEKDYYCLTPINDPTLLIKVPTDSISIKPILTKEEAHKIIEDIPKVDIIKSDDKSLENYIKNY